ncbi:MAG: hypothetical protein ACYC8T_29775 [Myxococcaceae bacterium]
MEQPGTDTHVGGSYLARKALFAKGIKDGRLSFQEIERALPAGALTPAERWLLYYSLRSAEVEIYDEAAASHPAHQEGAGPPA